MSLKKIAEMTGTSVSTVSRVLNNSDYACNDPNLSEKIWKAASEINYTPNTFARDLRLKRKTESTTFTVDIFITRFNSIEEDLFFHQLYQYLKEYLLQEGCVLGRIINSMEVMELLDNNSQKTEFVPYKSSTTVIKEKSKNALAYIKTMKDTGLIILGKCPPELIPVLKKRYVAVSGIDRNPTDHLYDEVVCNGATAAQKAIEYLLSLGHTNIAYIGDCTYESRYIGYYQTLLQHKISLNHNNIYPTNQTEQEGFDTMNDILSSENKPTAIFCANDCTALGVLKALKKSRKRGYIPSVISIDNIDMAQTTTPMLTTIDIPKQEMAHFAISLLLDRKKGMHTNNVRIELPCNLVIRESCSYV